MFRDICPPLKCELLSGDWSRLKVEAESSLSFGLPRGNPIPAAKL